LPPDFKLIGTEQADGLTEATFTLADHLQPNSLLKLLADKHQIYHFEEVIPSVNDIFIQKVQAA
jgi:ABC-2 type transport system ATP-binding protein